ncbi:murein hydrolase activator EnvC family protein [Yoonia vestfoldensis]|uniref:murein hydrolase activator EnvC family protein n=1 Tax=Yoonia vestfoldensis TaxID=245188 RepID=UPI000380616B|nr:peptidoglycan DD-metalloendopeptidase family protein [Yoonia vestfoldensis]
MLALPAAAQQTADEAARQLLAANAQLGAAEGAADQVTALTQTVQAYEAGLIAMRQSLREITEREAVLASELAARRDEIAGLLMVLASIGQSPQPVMLANPEGPVGAVRAGMMIADLAPALRDDVARLQGELDTLRDLRDRRVAAADMLREGLDFAQTARASLGRAISERQDVPRLFVEDPAQTAQRIASAETLGALAAELAALGSPGDSTREPAADLPLPVAGIISTGTRERPGITIAAAPRALVTSPVRATLLFRGPLLDYGNVIILEPAEDVLFVIAGMAEAFGEPGEIIEAGAPLGLMGGDVGMDDAMIGHNQAIEAGQTAQPLYLEVRGGQGSVNPDAWFALE